MANDCDAHVWKELSRCRHHGKARLGIARSGWKTPRVILRDVELIAELKSDYTVVIVTHNMQQAARCSDNTAYMYLGQLIEFGNTKEMFFKPKRRETEDYITGRFG